MNVKIAIATPFEHCSRCQFLEIEENVVVVEDFSDGDTRYTERSCKNYDLCLNAVNIAEMDK